MHDPAVATVTIPRNQLSILEALVSYYAFQAGDSARKPCSLCGYPQPKDWAHAFETKRVGPRPQDLEHTGSWHLTCYDLITHMESIAKLDKANLRKQIAKLHK